MTGSRSVLPPGVHITSAGVALMYADAERRITHTARRLLLKARQASYSLTVLPRALCPDPLSDSSAAVEMRALPLLLGMIELRLSFRDFKSEYLRQPKNRGKCVV